MQSDVDTVALLIEAAIDAQANAAPAGPVWQPQPGPQTNAYNCDADVIGYGGEAGGGKTDLALGIAGTKGFRSIIFRREFPRLEGITARSREIFSQGQSRLADSFNESLHRWSLENGKRTIQLAAMQYEDDKRNFQGRPYDKMIFDEAPEFTESQVRFVMGWNRSTRKGARPQTILTFNPPMDETQEWIVRFFAPWLQEGYHDPSADGEIRFVVRMDDRDDFFRSLDDVPAEVVEALKVKAVAAHFDSWEKMVKTRTFFRATLTDNPILAATGYASQIDSLPEPLRSILQGNFKAGKMVNPWQCIPTAWIKAAMERGRNTPKPEGQPMTELGMDVARGGKDKNVLAPLYGMWFDKLVKVPGAATPDGDSGAALIANAILWNGKDDNPYIIIDVVGIGSSVYDAARNLGLRVKAFSGGEKTTQRDKTQRFKFKNVRSASYWLFREALDSGNEAEVCLPDDPELLADLAAPRFKVVGGVIQVESKDDDTDDSGNRVKGIRSRLGRSPDCGDAVVEAWWLRMNSGPLVSF